MAQQNPAAGSGTTIQLSDMRLVLSCAKLRAKNGGRTALLAVTTPAPALIVDCGASKGLRAAAKTASLNAVNCLPMQRGHIGNVIKRVATEHGAREVRATWGQGVRALSAEPRYVLNGGVLA